MWSFWPATPEISVEAWLRSQVRRCIEEPLVLGQREAVGHPRDEVSDAARPVGLALSRLPAPRHPFGRQLMGRLVIAREQVEQHGFRLPHHQHDAWMAVHPLI